MFTGIIEEIGVVQRIQKGADSIKLTIAAIKVLQGSCVGDSIAVNGVCLTATKLGKTAFTADIMPESMHKTNMGGLKIGDAVNLERALTLSTRLGGHIVSGHIDGTGRIVKMDKDDNAVRVTIKAQPAIMKYIIAKGSVALDGVSLTVADLSENDFTVSLIPHTAKSTTLLQKNIGESINIENDVIGKYVERLLNFTSDKEAAKQIKATGQGAFNLSFLRENGF